MKHPLAWPLVVILSAGGLGFTVLPATAAPSLRVALALWFLLLCPGMALVPLLRLGAGVAEVPLAIALSIALDTAVAETQALTGRWSPAAGLIILMSLSIAGAALQIVRAQACTPPGGAA